jgi:hypothetical protein
MKFQSNAIFNGTITANSVADAGTNTDKFLVLNSSGLVTYRTALELYNDLGIGSLPAGFTSTVKHAVKAGVALTKGQAVYVTGADGTNMIVGKASNASEATSSKTMGLIESNLSNNGIGNVITEGLLAGLNTTGATNAGDPVWLGTDGNLIYGLTNKPYAPAHLVFIGIVTRINANNGEIFVKVQNGLELNELHDADLKTTTPINGHILGYNGTLWVNKTIAGWLGYTPVTNARTLTINGTAYDLSADRSWTINSMVYPSAGIAVSTGTAWGTSITDNSSNWNTAFGWGNHASAGYVPGARTLTINGTTFDLTANRSWTIDSTSASTRTVQKFTSTSNQSVFTITGGYTVGMVDVYVNGVKLDNAGDFTATNGTTVVLTDALIANQIVEVYKFGSQFIPNNALRQVTNFTATAGQTTFTVNYSVGLVDVYYNGSCLAQSEYTAINGTSIILATACQVNDIVVVYAYSYSVGAYSGIGGSGTTNYLPKFTSSSVIGNSLIFDNGTNVGIGTTTPSAKLTLIGGEMRWGFTSDMGALSYTGGNPMIQALGALNMIFATNGNERMRITSTGNVGIGTNSPDALLRIDSNTASANNNMLYLYNADFTSTTRSFIRVRNNISAGSTYSSYFGQGADKKTYIIANDTSRNDLVINGDDGYIGMGTKNPSSRLTIIRDSPFNTGDQALRIRATDGDGYNLWMGASSNGYATIQAYQDNVGGATLCLNPLNGGNVLIGTLSNVGQKLRIYQPSTAQWNIKLIQPNGSDQLFQEFLTTTDNDATNTARGSIRYNGTNVLYLGTSDYRLKEDLKDYNGLDVISQIKTYNFKWIEAGTRDYGVMAHELQEVLPNYVTGAKDDINEDGSINPQQVDYSKLVPVLVKAIQELKAELDSLKQLVK